MASFVIGSRLFDFSPVFPEADGVTCSKLVLNVSMSSGLFCEGLASSRPCSTKQVIGVFSSTVMRERKLLAVFYLYIQSNKTRAADCFTQPLSVFSLLGVWFFFLFRGFAEELTSHILSDMFDIRLFLCLILSTKYQTYSYRVWHWPSLHCVIKTSEIPQSGKWFCTLTVPEMLWVFVSIGADWLSFIVQ